jgi:squalene-hopene/tetraprenyl-beta-curcumene cyclase
MQTRWFLIPLVPLLSLTVLLTFPSRRTVEAKESRRAADPKRFTMGTCPTSDTRPHTGVPSIREDKAARLAAQRGLDFLGKETAAWFEHNKCYGCHVHAVTLEAFSVGLHNQYQVPKRELEAILGAMLDPPDGAHGPWGFSHQNGGWPETAKEFGGSAFARFDDWVDGRVRNELLLTARQLLQYQNADGSMRVSTNYAPVVPGPIAATAQALATWRQAYARTADDLWQVPMRKAETYLAQEAKRFAESSAPVSTQDINYALIGLTAAGANGGEGIIGALSRKLEQVQRSDGGFGFGADDASNPFATGQTLYALRLVGLTDESRPIARGTAWLIEHQAKDGGWSHAGFGKAEAMWAVLGLVSVDVLSVKLAGLEDGQHVGGIEKLRASATDNEKGFGGAVVKVELAIDDVPTFGACGSSLEYRWDTASLEPGKHLIDVSATNARGKTSHRRIEVYSGAVYLTQLASRYSDGGTLISLRDIAAPTAAHQVGLRIYSTKEKDGLPVKDALIHSGEQPGAQGPLSFYFGGKDQSGKSVPRAKYIAELRFVDADKKVIETEELLFLHDTPEAQKASFGEVQGEIKNDTDAPLANTQVDLVDERGRVVQSTRSTAGGQYRFKNVDQGKYKIRVAKRGFDTAEAPVDAKQSTESSASVNLLAH